MSVIGSDDREIITSFGFPYSTVTAVDFIREDENPTNFSLVDRSSGIGSGITIAPNHVLTAAHNAFNRDHRSPRRESIELGLRTTISKNLRDLETRELPLNFNFSADSDPDPNVIHVEYLADYKRSPKAENDIALFTTSDAPLKANEVIGLMAVVDPTTAQGLTIKTAGYPGDYVDSETGDRGRDLVRAPGGKNTTGTIVDVSSNGLIYYSENIDTHSGQSGSGIWHTLDKDDPPRVLGVHNSSADENNDLNYGRLITDDIYHKIIDRIEVVSGTGNADQLPENAIIGSENGNEIIGTYRRERIIGNGGNDTLDGGEGDADDRLQGDGGNDFLDGGEGDRDFAIFSEEYTTENYKYEEISGSGDEDQLITIEHIGGTKADGKDTLKGIEYGIFKGESVDLGTLSATPLASENGLEPQASTASATETTPRIIPLPLEDGVEDTEYVEVQDTTTNPNPNDPPTPPNVSLTAPVAMLDGDIDYTLNWTLGMRARKSAKITT